MLNRESKLFYAFSGAATYYSSIEDKYKKYYEIVTEGKNYRVRLKEEYQNDFTIS